MDLQVRGAQDFRALSRALKDAGAKDLTKELSRAISAAVRPVRDDARASARANLPRAGGLAEYVAGASIRTQRRTSARNPSITVTLSRRQAHGPGKINLAGMDRGKFRHPVHGRPEETRDKWKWVTQQVDPGWWSEVVAKVADRSRNQIDASMRIIARKLDRRAQ